ncbi:MAG: DUF7195 family protein [Plesiomonas sp.]
MADEEKKDVLRLSDTVVRRVVPMTASGCDNLRALRKYYQAKILKNKGVDVDIPYPTAIHMAISELCELKGIEVESSK